jgi:hypothetical protein
MHRHGPSCLGGPASRLADWWQHCSGELPADPEVRWELVRRLRREIARGAYETPEKWEATLDRLCERLEEE